MGIYLSGHRQSLPFPRFSGHSGRCRSLFLDMDVSFNMSISICISSICARSCSISLAGTGGALFQGVRRYIFVVFQSSSTFAEVFFRQAYMLALVYPISSDTNFILSPSSKQRCNASIFSSRDGFLGCPAVLTWVNSFRGGFGIPSFPIHGYMALLVG